MQYKWKLFGKLNTEELTSGSLIFIIKTKKICEQFYNEQELCMNGLYIDC